MTTTTTSADLAADTHALILAAGLGTRLKENTRDSPKCLVPVAGRAILERMLDGLEGLGVRRVTIMVGYMHDAIRGFVKSWAGDAARGLKVDFVQNDAFAQTGSVLSLEMGLQAMEPDRGYKHLLLIEGDVVADPRLLHRLLGPGARGADAATLLAAYKPSLNGTFATVSRSIVSAWLHESVREADFDLASSYKTVNLTFVRRGEPRVRLLEQVSRTIAKAGARAPLEHAMQALVEEGLRIEAVTTDGLPWFEVDTPDDLAIADALFQPVAEPA
jgi:choline kinase